MKIIIRLWIYYCVSLVTVGTSIGANATDFESALTAYRDDKKMQALEIVQGLLASAPNDAQLLLLKGAILADIGQKNEARTIFQKLIDEHPVLIEPRNNLAVLYSEVGEYDKARAVLETALKSSPTCAIAYENLTNIYAKLASQAYARALNIPSRTKDTEPKLRLINQVATQPLTQLSTVTKSVRIGDAQSVHRPSTASTVASGPAASSQPVSPLPTTATEPGKLADVRQALENWRRAWSGRDIDTYLNSYIPGYTPNQGVPHKQWVAERTARIVARKHIHVELTDLKLEQRREDTVVARFVQVYRSDAHNSRTRKELVLKFQRSRWLISSERTL